MKKIIAIAIIITMSLSSAAFAEDIFFAHNQFKKALAKNNFEMMSLVLSLEKTAEDVDDTEENKKKSKLLRKQIIYIGNCVQGMAYFEQDQNNMTRLMNNFEIVYENKSFCSDLKEESPSMHGLNTEKTRNYLLEFCNTCADKSSFFLGYAANKQGDTKKTRKYMTEYIEGKDKQYIISAHEHRLSARMQENHHDTAISDAAALTRLDPKNPQYWTALGYTKILWYNVSKDKSYLDDAKKALKEALAIDPKHKEANEIMDALNYIRKRDKI